MHKEADIREPLILADKTYKDITDDIIRPIESKAPKTWYLLLMIALVIAMWGIGCIVYLLGTGVGVWGLNKTVGWAWDCLLYTSPSPRDLSTSRMPSSA